MTTTNQNTNDARRTAYRSVYNVASLQRERAQILDEAAQALRRIDEQIGKETQVLIGLLRGAPRLAGNIQDAAREVRLNAGDLNSHFADAMERCGHTLYPPPYEPIRCAWGLVTNDVR